MGQLELNKKLSQIIIYKWVCNKHFLLPATFYQIQRKFKGMQSAKMIFLKQGAVNLNKKHR